MDSSGGDGGGEKKKTLANYAMHKSENSEPIET